MRSSLANRLAVLFALIVAGAIVIVYAYVVPSLRSNLQRQRIEALQLDARRYTSLVSQYVYSSDLASTLQEISAATGDRVTVLNVNQSGKGAYARMSSGGSSKDLAFPVVARTLKTGRVETGTEVTGNGRIGEAAVPLKFSVITDPTKIVTEFVVVFSGPLSGVDGNVALIRRRILAAGGIALVIAILLGIVVARGLSRRVVRLQRSAARVAAGDFSAHFPRDERDELGDLSRTLDAMQRQLAELDDARNRFIATASHELRTPIFSLGGFLELLERDDLDPETRSSFVAELRSQADRLTRLATDLLDLSRLEAGSIDLRREPTDIGALCRMVASEFTPALTAHESPLSLALRDEPIDAVCDPDRVAQIVRVLLSNALVHTPSGTRVGVGAQRVNGRVEVEVTDGGPGIAEHMRERIFEPFFTSDDAQGSGLGLAIAHELAERMSGDLTVTTEPGRTTFRLAIPA